MTSNTTLFSVIFIAIIVIYSYIYHQLTKYPEVPEVRETWWGKGEKKKDDTRIRPFKLEITQAEIQDLQLRLNLTKRFAAPLETTQHRYGLNPRIVHKFIHIIQTEYNFTERQEYLNQYPQFVTQIQGLDIYFLHITPDNPANLPVLPILLLHGWPSSVREFYEIIPTLTAQTNNNFVFEVVIPSLPGYGYSSASHKPDCQAEDVALVFVTLMRRLNHEKFYVHGSDWGGIVATHMATVFPEVLLGYHSNFCFSLRLISLVKTVLGNLYPSCMVRQELENDLYPLRNYVRFIFAESGYLHLQGTKPDTIGASLDNSPEGLFSFVLEKLSVGLNKNNIHLDGAGLEAIDTTALLDTILFYYWFPASTTTSARYYAENLNVNAFLERGIHNIPVDKKVPCGCAHFKHEFLYQTESVLRDKFTNLIHYETYKSAGHFSGLAEPHVLAKDIISFVTKTVN